MEQEGEKKTPKHDLDCLQHLSNLLHLFHHRNKNQHRRSIWWRHFSVFRRQLNAYVADLHILNQAPANHLEIIRKKAKDEALRIRVSERHALWQEVLLPKWQNSFSQLVADGRFAVLGIVLLAILAEACQVLGITAQLEEVGQLELEKVLEDFGKEYWADDNEAPAAHSPGQEDFGEVVARARDVSAASEAPAEIQPASQDWSTGRQRSTESHLKRKKRKKGDAIDDLFSGLG
ncbi:Ribonuclease MRP protein subunit rmp1 [Vermiconidia calcicola]|uniref:Ribonuclease MRP protein subunit rmp1 n=1 Tax=Vermiconidia calcicola TaxID=1690605 RepID=A0ACC3NFD0_9PEZI|nr:Ribonuclease MRP protein subunit rmp1 [Vermiconidia calcicola]